MTTEDFIIELFCRIDDQMSDVARHSQAGLYPSELVTVGVLFALKGVGGRAFYRWLSRDYGVWFPQLPERTRLFRRLKNQRQWTYRFLVKPSLLGVIDSYGIELIHPVRRGRNPGYFGASGISNHRWIVGAKWCVALNHLGQIIGWVWAPANAHDTWFHPLIEVFQDKTVLLADAGFHAASGDPPNLKICKRGEWNDRMLVETAFSMSTVVNHVKHMRHQMQDYFEAHLGYLTAMFNLITGWFGLPANDDGFVPISIAEFSL